MDVQSDDTPDCPDNKDRCGFNLALKPLHNNEAFTKLNMSYNNPAVRGPLRLNVDTGAGGNILPLRTYHQMFDNTPTNKILTPEPAAKLTLTKKRITLFDKKITTQKKSKLAHLRLLSKSNRL